MPLNPLAPVTDYQSMLNRIFWFTSASALAAVWMLRLYLPALDAALARIDFTLAFGAVKALPIPGGYLLPALAVGIATRVYRLHARVSDGLGIREHFDVEVIIAELADQLAIDLTHLGKERLLKARPTIMRKAFYPAVSSSQPQIDPQLIQQALDAWSWFWIGVETTLVFTLAGLGLIAGGVYDVGFYTIGVALFSAVIGLPPIHSQCRRYAIAQVRAILDDPVRVAIARNAFNELDSQEPPRRLAA
jgi:hypothetical protein